MAINYSVVGMRNPSLLGEGETKYYAKAQASGAVVIDQLAEEIAYATTLTDGDVVNAIRALVAQIRKHVQEGHIVRLESLGSFQAQLSSEGTSSEEEFNPSFIRKVKLQFRPGNSLKASLNVSALSFRKVKPLRSKTEEEGTEEETDV